MPVYHHVHCRRARTRIRSFYLFRRYRCRRSSAVVVDLPCCPRAYTRSRTYAPALVNGLSRVTHECSSCASPRRRRNATIARKRARLKTRQFSTTPITVSSYELYGLRARTQPLKIPIENNKKDIIELLFTAQRLSDLSDDVSDALRVL